MIPEVPDHIRPGARVVYKGQEYIVKNWYFGIPSCGDSRYTVIWVILTKYHDGGVEVDEKVEGTRNILPL